MQQGMKISESALNVWWILMSTLSILNLFKGTQWTKQRIRQKHTNFCSVYIYIFQNIPVQEKVIRSASGSGI